MALITCPDCKKKISENANSCPNCGFQLSPEKVATIKARKMESNFHDSFENDSGEEFDLKENNFHDSLKDISPQKTISKQKEDKNKSTLSGCLVIVIIAVIIGYFIFQPSKSKDLTPWNEKDEISMAYIMSQEFVTSKLKSPSTAKYPLSYGNGSKRMKGQQYSINSYVDSQNGFGAMIRTNFIVVVEQYEENEWKLIDLQTWNN